MYALITFYISETSLCLTYILPYCSIAGVKGQRLVGYTKHAKSEPGEEVRPPDKTTYCAIEIDNVWRFVDPNWGSTGEKSSKSAEYILVDDSGDGVMAPLKSKQQCIYECDDYYFLTDPELLIYTHLPVDEKWQLLARPVTLGEFTEMAFLKDQFFNLNLELLNQRRCVINTTTAEVDIKLKVPTNTKFTFYYKLWMQKKEKDHESLTRCCRMQQLDGILECILYFPFKGKYKFELYGGTSTNSKYIEETVPLDLLCVYVINSTGAVADLAKLPQNKHQEWGPGRRLSLAGLKAVSHHHALIEAQGGHTQILLKQKRPVEIATTLMMIDDSTNDEIEVTNCVTHYHTKDNEIEIQVNLSKAGTYSLAIYSREVNTDDSLPWACSYLIKSVDPSPEASPYPVKAIGTIHNGLCKTLRFVSHKSPLIKCTESGEETLIFTGIK